MNPELKSGQRKKALILGVGGQDGTYLSRLLLEHGYEVFGTSRSPNNNLLTENLATVGVLDRVRVLPLKLDEPDAVATLLRNVWPDEIYHLAGQSSVGLSFSQPIEALQSISISTLNILEAMRSLHFPGRLFNACSSECFGNTEESGATEKTAFRPRSPYAIAKAAAYWQVADYRSAYGLYASSGILFNHESPLRAPNFVTRKIVSGAYKIAQGKADSLQLGNLEVIRDWGWAPDYVDAMWRILQLDEPEDFVIATGKAHTLKEFLAAVFSRFGLDWQQHVLVDNSLIRPLDIEYSKGNPAKAESLLNWRTHTSFEGIVNHLVNAEKARGDAV